MYHCQPRVLSLCQVACGHYIYNVSLQVIQRHMMKNLHHVVKKSQKLSIEQIRELARPEDDVEEKLKGYLDELAIVKESLSALAPFAWYYQS